MATFREPAWPTSDNKIVAKFEFEVARKTNDLFDEAVSRYFKNSKYSLKSLHRASENNVGHYHVNFHKKPHSAVIHIKAFSSKKDIECVSEILEQLDESAVNFSKFYISKNGFYEEKIGPYFITCTEYFKGRHYRPESSDVVALSIGLSQLHDRLQKIPSVRDIEQTTKSVEFEKYDYLQNSHCFNGKFIPEHFSQMMRFAREYVDITWEDFGEKQICHGDLSPGNVLFSDKGQVIFLDFETAARNFKPVYLDIGMCGLRYCLSEKLDESEHNISEFIKNYSFKKIDHETFVKSMVNVACNSAVTLDFLLAKGDKFRLSEWQKVANWLRLLERIT